ncbi:MAG: hypothetical protein F6K21_03460 [Symploca sp. SIO2D2]|nr:hypothetical protein [Symploca sp. SIO2D2]
MANFPHSLTTIQLNGHLGDRYTPEFQAYVQTLGESLRCLFANFPTLKDYLLQCDNQGYRYKVIVKGHNWETQLDPERAERLGGFPVQGMTVIIIPVIAGSGGIGRLFLGIALIGIGILTGGTGLLIAGIAMTLQGILGGSPDSPKPEDEDKQSLVFGGAATTTNEGNRIPIIAAHRYIVGVQIVSFAIKSEYVAG